MIVQLLGDQVIFTTRDGEYQPDRAQVIAYDNSGELLTRCHVYVLHRHRSRTNAHSRAPMRILAPFTEVHAQNSVLEVPEGTWRPLAPVVQIRYRNFRHGFRYHDFHPPPSLYWCDGGYRMNMPSGCRVGPDWFEFP